MVSIRVEGMVNKGGRILSESVDQHAIVTFPLSSFISFHFTSFHFIPMFKEDSPSARGPPLKLLTKTLIV